MKEGLVELLASPCCRRDLVLRAETGGGGDVASGSLECSGCGRHYAIHHSVPRFVANEGYATSFSYEWIQYSALQVDSKGGHRWSRDAFVEKTALPLETLGCRRALDAGCGTGRFSEVVLDHGAEVVAVDLSRAVEAAQVNLGHRTGAHVVQADLFALPFKDGVFDLIFSLGVLHHTPDARRAFLGLPRHLREGGEIAIWVYARGRPWRVVGDLARTMTRRMSAERLHALCRRAVPALHTLRRLPVAGRLFAVLPVADHGRGLDADVLDTFDWYSPRYQSKHDYDEVVSWFVEAGLQRIERLPYPVSVRGMRARADREATTSLSRSPA